MRQSLPMWFASAILLIGWSAFPASAAEPAQAGSKKVFRAGAAASNITPPLGEPIVGNWTRPEARNIHDELHARCLVLDDGTTQIGFVICDNLGIAKEVYDEARELIAKETTLPAGNILMAATHTHSASLATSPNYKSFLARRIADGIRRAQANLEPAQIGWGGIAEPSEVFVRRWYSTNPEHLKNPFGGLDQVRMNPPAGSPDLLRPAAIPDPEISFVSVRSVEGRPIALLANYSLHYVGGVRSGDISADYFGIFSERIKELLGAEKQDPPFVGMLSNGTSGDVNNINFKERGPRKQPYEKMTEVAEKVAQRVLEAHGQIEFQDWVPLGSITRELPLKVRKPDEAMQKYFAEVMAKPEDAPKYHVRERTYAERVQALLEGPEEYVVPIQAVRIGDLGIAAIPFEVLTDIGLEIKENSPFDDSFTIELANDSRGYLPPPAQHELGGYESWMGTNRVQKDASVLIVKALMEMMAELKNAE